MKNHLFPKCCFLTLNCLLKILSTEKNIPHFLRDVLFDNNIANA